MTTKKRDSSDALYAQSEMGKLKAVIRLLDALPGRHSDYEARQLAAFQRMHDEVASGQLSRLSEKQRAYLDGVWDRLSKSAQTMAQNTNSEQGKRVLTPAVLRNLPKKPPGRS